MKTRGVYKRGNTYWIRYADPTGRIVRESAKTKNINEALKLLAKRKTEVAEGKYPQKVVIKPHTFSELAEEYLKYVSTQRSYKTKFYVVRQLKERFGDLILRRFTPLQIEKLQAEMLHDGYEIASINKTTTILKHMFTKATDWNMVEPEVAQRLKKAKNLRGENKRLRYLSKEEAQRLIECAESHLKPIIQVALYTGMRKSEILSLKWNDIDLKAGFIFLRKTKNHEPRQIPMCNALKTIMKDLFLRRRLDTEWVFFNPMNPSQRLLDIKKAFNTACKKARLNDFHFHDLRHTCASWLVMAGVDLRAVAEILGHKTIRMTMRYSHLSPEHLQKTVSVFDKILQTDTLTDTVLSR